ncbi:MAG TPA: hypothetical protein VGQ48_13825 [Gemmatimonadales bacterium]|jgi:hypothetical protein|nr:hypothetical protein [Gemmatimonadales bacterium]
MTDPRVAKRNSFLKAIALTVIVLIPIIVLAAMSGRDPEAAGRLAGYFSVGPILGGIAVGIWAKLDKHQWNWFAYIWRFVVCSIGLLGVSAVGRAGLGSPEMVDITETEKQHLVVSGTEVRHSDFGFAVPLPSEEFRLSSELQEQANQWFVERRLRGTYVWVLQNPDLSGVIMVVVSKGVGNSEAALRGLGRGLQKGASKADARILEDTMQWSSDAHEYRFATALPQGVYAKARCLSSPTSGQSSYIVCVQTVSKDPNWLDDARAGVRVAAWR